jgi:hypothetical protein
MVTNRHKYFRWTKRTAWISFAYVILVPAMLGTAGYMTDVSAAGLAMGEWKLMGHTGQMGDARKEKGRHHLGVLNEMRESESEVECIYG